MTTQLDLLQRDWCLLADNVLWKRLEVGATFTSDNLHQWLTPPEHPNWWGVLLAQLRRDPRYRNTGRYVKSSRPEANGRRVAVWEVV